MPRQPSWSTKSSGDSERVAVLEARVRDLERELAESRAEVDGLRQRWAAWLTLISHDLRGPLTLVLGYAQNILRRLPPELKQDERIQRELDSIVGGARRVDKMIGQVVDAARLECGLVGLDPRDADVGLLVDEEVRKARRLYPGRTFQVDVPSDVPLAYADTRRVGQILSSLLSNAAIFSTNDQPIEVRAWAEPDRVVVTVRDRGVGLGEEEMPRLFSGEFRSERARDVAREGLGLSLSIARQLAHLLGGDLWAESAGYDRGTVVSLALPPLPQDYPLPE